MEHEHENVSPPRTFTPLRLAIVISGLVLAASSVLARGSLSGLPFQSFWLLHVAAHCVAVFLALRAILAVAKGQGAFSLVAGFWMTLACAFAVALSRLPITSRDALIYHLYVPKVWNELGRIAEIPWHEWSYFPLLLSVSYAGFLSHGSEALVALYHGTFLLLSGALVAQSVAFHFPNRRTVLLTTTVFLTLPLGLRLAGEPLVDLAMATYCGLAISLLLERRDARSLLLCGLSVGLACSMKYSGLIVLGLGGLLYLLLERGQSASRRAFGVALYCLGTLAVYAPWALQNFLWTGNPVHPFFTEFITGTVDQSAFKRIAPLQYRLLLYGESIIDILLIPFRMILFGADGSARTFDGVLSPVLLLSVLSPLVMRARLWLRGVFLFCLFYFAINLVLFDTVTRYLSPLLIPVALLFASVVSEASMRVAKPTFAAVSFVLLGIHIFWTGYVGAMSAGQVQLAPYLSGRLNEDAYLRSSLASFPLIDFANSALPQDARVLLLYTGNLYYYYDREVQGSYFSADRILAGLGSAGSTPELLRLLQTEGITHLAIHVPRMNQIVRDTFTAAQQAGWETFLREHGETVYFEAGQAVVAITPGA